MIVRPATETDLEVVSTVTVEAYVGDGSQSANSDYVADLADAKSRYMDGGLLVAEVDGAVVGTVTFAPYGSAYAEVSDLGEAEFRMLAVSSAARGRGIGVALVQECISLAYGHGYRVLRLCTQIERVPALRIYDQLGFRRTPDRDWSPRPDVMLIAYELGLHAFDDGQRELEPPRYCGACGRRMVVQITPAGWTARCSVHGTRRS